MQPSRPGPPPARGARRGRGRPPLNRPPRTDGQQQLLQALRGRGGLGAPRARQAASTTNPEAGESEGETVGEEMEEVAATPAAQSQNRKARASLEGQPPDKEKR